ncbi:Ldh family oxidoreductase [Alkalihalobacillus oceani]|uniref:Ldh family oxidoreductase n=1 Tax=Halalkalibacter oceani TaxID=1653776 RepID=A0A9X2DU74_9BACI|nr:Ldh family oxidoreductase [Halalkalibacter oceani]MCM3716492.1 Ldh family oxidoreductase [Halalkalibacter oceani]
MGKSYVIKTNEYMRMGRDLFLQFGVSEQHAESLLNNLLDADQKGIYTHGFHRIAPVYIRHIKQGNINPQPNFILVKDEPNIKIIDADNGLGAVAAEKAMHEAIRISQERGVGVVGVRNSNHFGTAAYYSEMAAKEDLIGLSFTNASPGIAPTGSSKPLLGNNPWAIACPSHLDYPISLDIANSIVARGKIRLAAAKGEPIPLGWSLTKDGKPTTDPNEALESGIILPIGDYKGYGIALMVDILTGILTGSNFADEVLSFETNGKRKCGHLFIALNIQSFMRIDEFKERIQILVEKIKAAPKLDERREVLLPGEIEWTKKLNQQEGTVKVLEPFVCDMKELCQEYGVELPDYQAAE